MQHFELCDPGSRLIFKAQVGCVLLLPATSKNDLGDACSPPPSMRRLYFLLRYLNVLKAGYSSGFANSFIAPRTP